MKDNGVGYRFSNIHADPMLNEEDGLYYPVTKLEIHNKDGNMVLIPSLYGHGRIRCETVDGGTIVYSTRQHEDGDTVDCQAFFPGAYLQGMTVTTNAKYDGDTDLNRELHEKYGIQDDADFLIKYHYKEDVFHLCVNDGSGEVVIDEDFDYPMETMTVNGIVLSKTSTVEIQHIIETMEECFESVQSVEDLTNSIMFDTSVRIVDSVTYADLVDETEINEGQKYSDYCDSDDKTHNWKPIAYSVSSTEPNLNEGDGLYYSVTEVDIKNFDGQVVLLSGLSDGRIKCESVEGGTVVTYNTPIDGVKNGHRTYQAFIPDVYLQGMTVTTYGDMRPGTVYYNELCEKYGITPSNYTFMALTIRQEETTQCISVMRKIQML